MVQTSGNEDCHVILRGGTGGPNYDDASVSAAVERLGAAGLAPKVMVDCSHANSGKDHERQAQVALEVAGTVARARRAGADPVISGVMLESFLVPGAQPVDAGDLVYGQSVTDKCMGWEASAQVLADLARAGR